MDSMNLCKIAYDFLAENNLQGIYMAVDIDDSLVFYGGNPEEVYYGIRTVSVNKETGVVGWFDSNSNRAKIKSGKEIAIPEEYKYKAS